MRARYQFFTGLLKRPCMCLQSHSPRSQMNTAKTKNPTPSNTVAAVDEKIAEIPFSTTVRERNS